MVNLVISLGDINVSNSSGYTAVSDENLDLLVIDLRLNHGMKAMVISYGVNEISNVLVYFVFINNGIKIAN